MRLGIFSRPERKTAPAAGERLVVIGVRHHSPACARLVRQAIARHRPAFVLIEGPADFNPHLADLRLDHQLPLAIFSYHASRHRSFASYSPFCAYSPEWEALQAAWEVGATPLFCDLPAWHPDFGERANRYADPHGRRAAVAEAAVAGALGEDGRDAVWDALAEQAPADELERRLDRYFDLLRPEGGEDPQELSRERFMAAHAAWALKEAQNRKVVLVCGGWHAEAIRRLAREADGERPAVPAPTGDERAGSYLVPYDYRRLDRFTGYASGMPSPAYYEQVFARGLDAAADWAENAIAQAMRAAGQVVSTADRVAWHTHAQALAMARGHRTRLRSDLLDAALATLVKDGLDQPAAWSRDGAVRAGTHPALVAMLKALTGERRGRLAPGTRRPPLITDIEIRLAEAGLTPDHRARQIELDWNVAADRERAHTLNALRLLGMPGLERLEGPLAPRTAAPRETFRLVLHRDAEGTLIEASRWGGTLPMAAAALLSDRAAQAGGDLKILSLCLADALFAGLLVLENDLTAQLAQGIALSHDMGAIGAAGRLAVQLHRFGEIFGIAARQALGELCEAVFDKVLQTAESIHNDEEGLRAIPAFAACRDMLRDCPDLDIERDAFLATLGRCLANAETAPAVAGAALGTLVACGEGGAYDVAGRMHRFSRPDQLGDFLSGLFALAREEIAADTAVIDAVRALIDGWHDDAFLTALPALRQAFAFFPPRERERLSRVILRAHGASEAQAEIQALEWMRQPAHVTDQAAALALEAIVARRLADAGLV
ncbi:hypothetical protein GB927_003815 [Shinella sp. CPCC 100929]|uniref:Uncharacterized protein n=1 Tax=Shinella lacus TaxID=2654216 RepID=A0ABT1R1U7_9HYPH|nr:DUF5682 family protein [Shinella lacus]MCQ4629149.1 hypothetical protein [Shinella lacus]